MRQRFYEAVRGMLLLSLFLLAGSAHAQTQIEKFVPGSTLEGVSYFLPRTALRMVVTVEKTVVTPGEFHMYAFKYMRMQDVPVQPSTTWEVKDVKLMPYGVPDKNKAYSLKLNKRTIAPLVSLTSDGILLGINNTVEETVLPPLPQSRILEEGIQPNEARKYMTREMLQAGSSAKMAQLVAQEIYDIRESHDALVRGEADNTPKDGLQLKLMLESLERQHRALSSTFVGSKEVSEMFYVIDIVPAEETDKLLLFRFSKWNGLVDSDDMSGAPYYISLKRNAELPETTFDPAVFNKKGKLQRAVYYNVPLRTMVKVFNAEHTFTELEVPIAQFGCEEILSNVLFDKNTDTQVTFFQHTGGIKEIKTSVEE